MPSTNLKPAQISKRESRSATVPSAGQAGGIGTGPLSGSLDTASNVPGVVAVAAGRKRKRDDGSGDRDAPASSSADPLTREGRRLQDGSDGEVDGASPRRLSSDECRAVLKSQQVKITALTGPLSSHPSSRKAGKKKKRLNN